ncbi:MAG: hypothetical protein ACOCQD_02645 [archaeon]
MGKHVVLTVDEYRNLLRDKIVLKQLEFGGVDNWEWYGESLTQLLQEYPEVEELDEAIELEVDKKVQQKLKELNE